MAAKEIKARFIDRIKRTDTIESFRFLPEERIEFTAGQFLEVIFDENNRKNRDLNKYLSFSASPAKDYVEVTKRLSESAFSGKLRALRPGDTVLVKAPLGNCVFSPEYGKIAFLIGGIGITPVISIIEDIINKKIGTNVVLLYSNRTEEDIAFKKELDAWQAERCGIRVIYTVTDCTPKDSACIIGPINNSSVAANIPDFKERVIFVFGPPKMVEAIKAMCLDLGCAPERVKTEGFAGY